MIALFFDTETTGFRTPEFTPEIVQIAAILQDTETRQVFTEINLLVQICREIPPDATAIHGITTDVAKKFGVSYYTTQTIFLELLRLAEMIVAHNIEFDIDMLDTLLLDINGDEEFAHLVKYDTMRESIDIVSLPPGTYHQVDYSEHKPPKLREAYEFFMGKPIENAHDAMADARACRDVYFAIQTYNGAKDNENRIRQD